MIIHADLDRLFVRCSSVFYSHDNIFRYTTDSFKETWVAWLIQPCDSYVPVEPMIEFPLKRVATSSIHQPPNPSTRSSFNLARFPRTTASFVLSWISKGNIPVYSLAGSGFQTAPARPADPHNSPAHSSELLDYIIVFATLTMCIYVTSSFSEKRARPNLICS